MQNDLQEIKNDIYLVWKYTKDQAQSDALKEVARKIDELMEKESTK